MNLKTKHNNIIFFDSECIMCNSSVRLIYKYDTEHRFKYSDLNSHTSKQFNIHNKFKNNDSVILYLNNQFYIHSDAVLMILKQLKYFRFLYFILKIIPKTIRDFVYKLIAKYRKKIFSKSEKCTILAPGLKKQILK